MGYQAMTEDEWWAFLDAPVRPALLATVRVERAVTARDVAN